MMRPFRKPPPLLLPLFTILVMGYEVYACSCETYGQPRKDAREYYTKKFDGAIFTGTIKAIKHDPAADSGGITMSKLTVEVDEYWRGVTNQLLTVHVFGPNTSCSVDWKVGTKMFVIASRYKGELYRSDCDLVNWGGYYPEAKWADYTRRTLGRARRFRKPN
jgi:hypothetical protein